MRILQVSISVNSGSVGRIAEQIGEQILEQEWESYITFARENLPSRSETIRIGTMKDVYWHVIATRIFDNHGFESKRATRKLVEKIESIKPDIIHLHHLHGYFINIKILFDYLSQIDIPIVWTFHDCWAFTGHCSHYDYVNCQKWQTHCFCCPQKIQYPRSLFFDRSRQNYADKKRLFTSVKNMTIIPVSYWLEKEVKKSFLKSYPRAVIQNGIDTTVFCPQNSREKLLEQYSINHECFIILGVASTWGVRKGFNYFLELSKIIPKNYQIILVGLSNKQLHSLPKNILGFKKTESVIELAELYSAADVFVNPTLEDTFPTTNLEAIACGTPVITFSTGGSVESVCSSTGIVVEKGNITMLKDAIDEVRFRTKKFYTESCVLKGKKLFNKNDRFKEYIELYKRIIQ